MAGASGDYAKLASLGAMLEGLGEGDLGDLSQVLAAEALTQVQLGFVESRDPYGGPWKPVKRGGEPLRLTGRLMSSWVARPGERGFTIATNVEYAGYHQDGTRRRTARQRRENRPGTGKRIIEPRMMIPRPGELPMIWSQALEDVAREWMDRRART